MPSKNVVVLTQKKEMNFIGWVKGGGIGVGNKPNINISCHSVQESG